MTKLTLSLLGLFLTQIAFTASALDLGAKAGFSPYDPYMTPVKRVLSKVSGEEDSLNRVRGLMRVGRGFRYSYSQPYTASLPEVTAARRAGDCKDKALWMLNQLNDESARFVIGKARRSSQMSHAWVMWQHEGRWWILDCTNRRDPIPADRVGSGSYIPMFSYSKSGTYRHELSTTMFAASGRGHRAPVASSGSERRR